MSLTPVGDMGIALKADIDDYQKSMATASDATSLLGGSIRGVIASVRNLGLAMTVASAAAGAGMFLLARNAQKVNSAFREVDTISDEVANAQREYGDLVSDLNTKFGLQADRMEVIDGLYQSVSAGIQEGAESQREFLETAAELAVVGRVGLAETVDVLSTVMNTYGLEADMAQDVSETLFQTVQFGKVRMEELAPVLGRVAALGSDMSVQIDEIGASMAVLTRTGFEARVAATGLRNIFRSMMKPSENMKKMLRSVALENKTISETWNNQTELVGNVAQEYQNAAQAVRDLETAQKEARRTVEESSLVIQEARLKIQAIEQGRLDQLTELSSKQVENADTVEELQSIISNYRFKTKQARVEEEQHRLKLEKKQKRLKKLRKDFKKNIDLQGDLGRSVGSLVLSEQGLIETLVQLRSKAEEQNMAFSELFPRTRALQAALALVGEDGQLLTKVFQDMKSGVFDAQEAWEENKNNLQENFDSFEEFKKSTRELRDANLQDWFKQATGPQQKLRNSIARLKEGIQDLGQLFSKELTSDISTIASKITTFVDKINSLEERVKDNISTFSLLAVSIGLVLGPLLFFGGQIALIATSMGSAFIPFMLLAGTALGGLASALWRVLNPAEEMKKKMGGGTAVMPGKDQVSESAKLFNSMGDIFNKIISIVKRMKQLFVTETLPGMIHAGRAFMEVIKAVSEQMSGFMGEENMTPLKTMAVLLGELFFRVGDFLKENKKLIASLAVMAVDILANQVVPNLKDFVIGLKDVLMNVNPKPFIAFAIVMGKMALEVINLIGWLGRFMTEHQKILGMLVTAAGIGFLFVATLLKIARGVIAVASRFKWLITVGNILFTVFVAWIAPLSTTSALLAVLQGWLATVIPYFGLVSAAVSYLAAGISTLIGFLASLVSWPVLIVAALIGLVAVAWIVRHEAVAAIKSLASMWIDIFGTIHDLITGDIGWKEAGKKIVQRIAEGIRTQAGLVKKAIKTVVDTVSDYLPMSPAKKGPLSKKPPKKSGKAITTDFAQGINSNMGEVEGAMGNIPTTPEDGGNFDIGGEGGMGGGPTKQIDVHEKAIYFAEGAFQGISEEEMPEKVRDEVEVVLEEEVVEKVEGKGKLEPTRT